MTNEPQKKNDMKDQIKIMVIRLKLILSPMLRWKNIDERIVLPLTQRKI